MALRFYVFPINQRNHITCCVALSLELNVCDGLLVGLVEQSLRTFLNPLDRYLKLYLRKLQFIVSVDVFVRSMYSYLSYHQIYLIYGIILRESLVASQSLSHDWNIVFFSKFKDLISDDMTPQNHKGIPHSANY